MAEEKDVIQTPSPEGVEAPSPEAQDPQDSGTETPTPHEGVTPGQEEQPTEEQTVPYDRFKEKVDETNFLKSQLERANEILQRQPTPASPQPQDRYAGKTPEEKAFYEDRDKRMREIAAEEGKKYIPVMAGIQGENFLLKHPDIKPGTPEYDVAIKLIAQGYPGDHAYQLATYDKKVGEKEATNQQTQQQRLEAKKKANVVSSQSVSSAVAPSKKETYEEELARKMNSEWDGSF